MKEIVFGVSAAGSMYIAGIPKEDVLIIPNNFYYGSIATHTGKISSKTTKKENFEKSIKNNETFSYGIHQKMSGNFQDFIMFAHFCQTITAWRTPWILTFYVLKSVLVGQRQIQTL